MRHSLVDIEVYVSRMSLEMEKETEMGRYIGVCVTWAMITAVSAQGEVTGSDRNHASALDAEAIHRAYGITKADLPIPMMAQTAPTKTFAEAFRDPNILIGVFTWPLSPDPTELSSGEILERLPGYYEADSRFSLNVLRLEKAVKGKFVEPFILVSTIPAPIIEGRPVAPYFGPAPGSRWVLALEKTTREIRTARFGKDIEQYGFLNDNTMFKVLWHGYGALCLQWPDEDKGFHGPSYLAKAPANIVADFEAIQRVMPLMQKEKMTSKEAATVKSVQTNMETDLGRSIIQTVLANTTRAARDDAGESQ